MLDEINDLIKTVGPIFCEKRLFLVTAESCTGGGLAHYISKTPACSFILERGFITYSLKSKEQMLEVKPHTLQMHGAVSKETALEMAAGALKNSGAQISIALTGIAEAIGDNSDQTVGSLWIACAGIDRDSAAYFREIPGDREEFVQGAIKEGLKVLIEFVR
jgi:nicotinamide-nucleotide amidase